MNGVVEDANDEIQIATGMLLTESRQLPFAERWLVLGREAALPNGIVARDDVAVTWVATDVRQRQRVDRGVVVCNNAIHGAYDRVVLPVPPDRDLARRWLVTARDALASGGVVILAGANAEGIRSVIADATALFGAPQSEQYRQKHRVARFVAPGEVADAPAWAEADGIRPGSWQSFEVATGDDVISLETMPGVFAGDRLDAGTRLLLDHLRVEPGQRVLDVGCGAGIIGIRAARLGAGAVDLVDANLLAVAAAQRNLERLGIAGRALASDVFSVVADERYDLIVSNPPFHRGKRVDLTVADRLISEAPQHLMPDGRLLIVANAFLAYGRQMERVFGRVETVVATRQYHVLLASEPR